MPRFSIVYPTRHRPQFIAEALRVLELQQFDDFEVIVADNYVDPALSCEPVCRNAKIPVKYVRPSEPVGMVANWNFALSHATGDYVCFFTDKMVLLPGALAHVNRVLGRTGDPEIINWASDVFAPDSFRDYFGAGWYIGVATDVKDTTYDRFSPREELDRKGRADISRNEQSPSHYARGKILFGAYRRQLINRIVTRAGALFQGIAPDYTSMILGLSMAESAIELRIPQVVSISTDLSNGSLVETSDSSALDFIRSLEDSEAKLRDLMIPGLYAAISNLCAHDYLTMKARHGLEFDFNSENWAAYCLLEIEHPKRVWSTPTVEAEQRKLLSDYLAQLGLDAERAIREKAQRTVTSAASLHEPRFVFQSGSLNAAIVRRAGRFLSLSLAVSALARYFEHNVLSSEFVQRNVMKRDWPGKKMVRSLYRRLSSRVT